MSDMRRREFIALLGGAAARPLRGARAGPIVLDSWSRSLEMHPRSSRSSMRCAPTASVKVRNLTIIPGGFQVRNEQTSELVPALVKAAPDATMS
jgi:hypothetical protein